MKTLFTILLLSPFLAFAQSFGIHTNIAGPILYPVITNKMSKSFSISLEFQVRNAEAICPTMIYNESKSVIDFGQEVYNDLINRTGVQFQYKYYTLKQEHEGLATKFFAGAHLDVHYADRQITCVRKTDHVFTRYEKRLGFIIGVGGNIGYTFLIHGITIEPCFGLGFSGLTGSLNTSNDNDDNTLLVGTPTYFQFNVGYRF